MKFRIRLDKNGLYVPEVKGWFFWNSFIDKQELTKALAKGYGDIYFGMHSSMPTYVCKTLKAAENFLRLYKKQEVLRAKLKAQSKVIKTYVA